MSARKQIVLSLILTVLFSVADAQNKFTNNWYFGNGVGINFNTNPPSALFTGQLFADEGCASISDNSGALLFYTDGINVFNKKHKIMPNGESLKGGATSTQNSIIVPLPESNSEYYIFTVDKMLGSEGLYYSVVDMTLDAGNGDVKSGKKNVEMGYLTTEKISATHHSNGRDIWIVTHARESSSFFAFLLTPDGIDDNVVESKVGETYSLSEELKGQMKFDVFSKKAVCAISGRDLVQIFDFDNFTGKLSNAVSLNVQNPYGVEFSRDGKKLYVSQANTFNISSYGLYQFDLNASSGSGINSSKFLFETQSPRGFGSLQLGSDNKIYVTRHNKTYVGAVKNPEADASTLSYDAFELDLVTDVGWYGLPNFVTSFFRNVDRIDFELINDCYGDRTSFLFTGTEGYDSLVWTFGDETEKVISFNSEIEHHFDSAGSYKIRLERFENGLSYYIEREIFLNESGLTVEEYEGCEGYSVTVGDKVYDKTGIYQDLLSKCDTLITKLTINPIPEFSYEIVNDSCESLIGAIFIKNLKGTPPYDFDWNYNSNASSLNNLSAGTYSLTITDSKGCERSETFQVDNDNSGCMPYIYVPDSFSPNGDGRNDVFSVSTTYIEYYYLKVINSWGEIIFTTKDQNDSWDGKHQGKDCKPGVYAVMIEYSLLNEPERKLIYRGTLNLIK